MKEDKKHIRLMEKTLSELQQAALEGYLLSTTNWDATHLSRHLPYRWTTSYPTSRIISTTPDSWPSSRLLKLPAWGPLTK